MNPNQPAQASAPPEKPTAERAAGRTEPSPLPPPGVDRKTGRLIPRIETEAERAARIEHLRRELAEIDANDDTPEEIYDQFFRNMDEERRRDGRPPAFEGLY